MDHFVIARHFFRGSSIWRELAPCRRRRGSPRIAKMSKLSEKEKDMISAVSQFFEDERNLGKRLHVRDVVKRTSLACGVSVSTVKRCRCRSFGENYREHGDEETVQGRQGGPR